MTSKLEPMIWLCDTGQWIPCFDRCQLIKTWMSNIKDVCSIKNYMYHDTGHIGIHGGVNGRTYVWTVDDIMAIKPKFLASMGYHIFLQ